MGYIESEPSLVKQLKLALKDKEQKYQHEYVKNRDSYATTELRREIVKLERLIRSLSVPTA